MLLQMHVNTCEYVVSVVLTKENVCKEPRYMNILPASTIFFVGEPHPHPKLEGRGDQAVLGIIDQCGWR